MAADHVIIGSGINALVAAALLALQGRQRVLVLEREDRIGGCLRTDEVTLPGFHHDVMAATFVLFMTSPAGAALGPRSCAARVRVCATRPHPTAVLRPDGTALVLTTDRAANVAAFNALAPGDGDRHAADVGAIEADAPFLFALLGGSLWSWPTAKLLMRAGAQARACAGWRPGSARRWPRRGAGWRRAITARLVQALWAPWVLHCGLTPESTYSGQMGKVIAFALEAAGAPIVKGGSGQAVAAFRALIEEKGGEIRTGADVDRIEVAGGRVHRRHAGLGRRRSPRARSWPRSRRGSCRAAAARREPARGSGGGAGLPPRARQFPAALRAGPAPRMAVAGAGGCGADPSGGRHRLRCRNPRTRPNAACCPRCRRSAWASRTGWTRPAAPKARRSSGCRSPMRRASSRAMRRARSQPTADWTEATREAFADRIEAHPDAPYQGFRPHQAGPPRLFARRSGAR